MSGFEAAKKRKRRTTAPVRNSSSSKYLKNWTTFSFIRFALSTSLEKSALEDSSFMPSHASSNTGIRGMQNSRIVSKSAQKTPLSLSEDLNEQGSKMSHVEVLNCMEDLSLKSISPVERNKLEKIESGKITCNFSPITTSNGKEIRCKAAHEDNGSSKKEMDVSAGSDTSHRSFDICPPKITDVVKLNAPLLLKNREKRNELKRIKEGNTISILRPGMILLKKYLSLSDQVKLVRICRDLGMGLGGFYQPGYYDGAILNLKMMCLAFVVLLTLPLFYEKHEHQLDAFAKKASVQLKRQYGVLDEKVLQKMPSLRRKQNSD